LSVSKSNKDVTVVCHKESLEQIKSYTSTLSLDLEIKVEAPSSLEDNMGSADVMGMLKDSVTVCQTSEHITDIT